MRGPSPLALLLLAAAALLLADAARTRQQQWATTTTTTAPSRSHTPQPQQGPSTGGVQSRSLLQQASPSPGINGDGGGEVAVGRRRSLLQALQVEGGRGGGEEGGDPHARTRAHTRAVDCSGEPLPPLPPTLHPPRLRCAPCT